MSQVEDEIAARRFFTLNAIRISGAMMIALGLSVLANGFANLPKIFGAIVLVLGLLEFIVAPVLLSRAWKSKPD
jgi:hypothetical protein